MTFLKWTVFNYKLREKEQMEYVWIGLPSNIPKWLKTSVTLLHLRGKRICACCLKQGHLHLWNTKPIFVPNSEIFSWALVEPQCGWTTSFNRIYTCYSLLAQETTSVTCSHQGKYSRKVQGNNTWTFENMWKSTEMENILRVLVSEWNDF